MAKEEGILLLMVWENDWKNNSMEIQQDLKNFFELVGNDKSVDSIDIPHLLTKVKSDIY